MVADLTVHRGECPVVDRVSFQAAAGQVTALVGPNGAGKTTVLKALLGLLPIAAGRLSWNGRDLVKAAPCDRARLAAYVPQHSLLHAGLSVRRVVAMGRYAHQGAFAGLRVQDNAAITAALAEVDATHLADRRFDELSHGEGHRVLLARALATEAPLILLDEPTSSLDIGHALAVLKLMRRLAAAGRAVVTVLHHLDEVAQVADHVVLLHRGRALASGAVADVLHPGPLAQAFGVVPVVGGALGFRPVEDT